MENYKLLSLDIWDTIIRRKCHPDEIKVSTSRFIFLKYNCFLKEEFKNIIAITKERVNCERFLGNGTSEEYDDEYYIIDVFKLLLEKIFVEQNTCNIDEACKNLYDYELNLEKESTYLDPTILDEIKKISYDKLAYLSDFYADTNFLDEILKNAGFSLNLDYKYVSCEKKLNKRSGRLFDKIESDLNINPNEHIHIGDNKYSDYEVPSKKGIKSICYNPENESQLRRKKEGLFNIDSIRQITDFKDTIKEYKEKLEAENTNLSGYKTGQDISLFFFAFVLWIIQECIKNGIDEVYYFTREGEFYKKIHEQIEKNNPLGMKIPKSNVLEVSRIATFGASLREVTLKEMMRIWNQYSIQSMGAFFKSVALPLKNIQKFLTKYNISASEVITYPWQDKRVQDMFEDAEFKSVFEQNISLLRNNFIEYAVSKGLNTDENKKIAIVDIGWRGTIQDNVCYLLPNYNIYGYYVGLVQFLNEQPENSVKAGFLNKYEHSEVLLQNITPFEMICNSPNGSVVSYENAVAKRKKDEYEDNIYYRYTQNVQKSILDMVEIYCNIVKLHALTSEDMEHTAFKVFEELKRNPRKDLADIFFLLKHNEEFGLGEFVDKRTKFRPFLMFLALFSHKYRKKLNEFLNNTSWPQGYLIKYNLKLANKIYNDMLDKRNIK